MLAGELPTDEGVIVEGVLPIPADASGEPAGLYVETAENGGTGILVRPNGVTEFGSMQADGTGFKSDLRADRELRFSSTARFRLALKGWLLEFYLDDILMECYSLPSRATGRIGLLGSPNRPADLRACAGVEVSGQRSAVSGQRSASIEASDQQSAVSDQRSAVSSQPRRQRRTDAEEDRSQVA